MARQPRMSKRIVMKLRQLQQIEGEAGKKDHWHQFNRDRSPSWNRLDQETRKAIEKQDADAQQLARKEAQQAIKEVNQMIAWLEKR